MAHGRRRVHAAGGDGGQVGRPCHLTEVWPRAGHGDLPHPGAPVCSVGAAVCPSGAVGRQTQRSGPAAAGRRATRSWKRVPSGSSVCCSAPRHAEGSRRHTVSLSFLFALPSPRRAHREGWRGDKNARPAQMPQDSFLVSFLSSDRWKLHCCDFPSHCQMDSASHRHGDPQRKPHVILHLMMESTLFCTCCPPKILLATEQQDTVALGCI